MPLDNEVREKLAALFSADTVNKISQIPIPREQIADQVAWYGMGLNVFSVKYAYGRIASRAENSGGVGCSWVWRLVVPERIKACLWRGSNDGICDAGDEHEMPSLWSFCRGCATFDYSVQPVADSVGEAALGWNLANRPSTELWQALQGKGMGRG